MIAAPVVVTIYVRHSAGCRYAGDEYARRCDCRKHLRWTSGGVRQRRQAGTRSWEEAERIKRELEDQLAGRGGTSADGDAKSISDAIDLFLTEKKVLGVSEEVVGKYTRELHRFRDHCHRSNVYGVAGINRELLTRYSATWEKQYKSTQTRAAVRTRCKGFLAYCYEAGWTNAILKLPKVSVDAIPTLPLDSAEFEDLLAAIDTAKLSETPTRVRALILLMRWSGLAITDALKLQRSQIRKHPTRDLWSVVTKRQKTGTHISVPLPPTIAATILAASPEESTYLFWDGKSDITKSWTKYVLLPLFKAAGLHGTGTMVSHRLRDTFACDLLSKGVPIGEVSKLLGHTSIKTTEKHYAAWVQSRQDRLDDLVVATWS